MCPLTGPLGVLIYGFAVLNNFRNSDFVTGKRVYDPNEPPKTLGERWEDYWAGAWKEVKTDITAEDKSKKDTIE